MLGQKITSNIGSKQINGLPECNIGKVMVPTYVFLNAICLLAEPQITESAKLYRNEIIYKLTCGLRVENCFQSNMNSEMGER